MTVSLGDCGVQIGTAHRAPAVGAVALALGVERIVLTHDWLPLHS